MPITHLRLPQTLLKLTFGWMFNQSVAHLQLPNQLLSLNLFAGKMKGLHNLSLPSSKLILLMHLANVESHQLCYVCQTLNMTTI